MRYLAFLFLLLLFGSLSAQNPTFALRLVNPVSDNGKFRVDVEMAGNQTFNLGSSNLQILFNEQAIDQPVLHSHNLTETVVVPPFPPLTVYFTPTVTEPVPGKASLNIVLSTQNFGDAISDINNGYTNLATLEFDIIDPNASVDLAWSYLGNTQETVALLHDDITQIFATSPAHLEGLASFSLPVDWAYFTARKNADNASSVILNWGTAQEVDNDYFTVERSQDGLNWVSLAQINAKNTIEGASYDYIDQQLPRSGRLLYRIRQTDFDGSFGHSDIRLVRIESGGDPIVFPTIFHDHLQVSGEEEDFNFQLLDNRGITIRSGKLNGYNSQIDGLAHFPRGQYYLQLQLANGPKTIVLIKGH